ncbi:unnamed protein product [Cladocopium goreaui]|uniref:Probable alpha-1,6-mannosyltransferase MNN10 (Bu d emergence delay protein 1) (Mannan polymerase II complex MNN10 subunit) (M-Pol II subunit MNN10) n=1 Tax=Cladocopium goreaui TaxID=2562237 RepID=A0A9P1BVS0_9DINO|nr:unnamed protein product [Cladocopium goreaui]
MDSAREHCAGAGPVPPPNSPNARAELEPLDLQDGLRSGHRRGAADNLWNDLAAYLQPQEASAERLSILSSTLEDILMPFGVVDPTVALGCPLGTSAALQELASVCVGLLGEGCLQRGLRLLHLSKLFMLFQFNDFGAWFSFSRWRTDMQRIASSSQALHSAAKSQTAGAVGAVDVVDPSFKEPGWRIGLVTYCNYNNSATNLTAQSRSSKGAYAKKHGYKLLHIEEPFVTQAHPWMNKLIAIQRNLEDYDWLFWVDCDLFFMNPAKTVDALIHAAFTRTPDASLLIAEDGMMLNSGSFLLRNNAWGKDFLARTVDLLSAPMPQSFQHMPWHEQAPLMYLGLVPSVLEGLQSPSMPGPLSAGYDSHVVLLRQRALNSYPQELVQKTKHALPHDGFEEGDLVISFNGCSSVLGRDFCEDMYQRYHDESA